MMMMMMMMMMRTMTMTAMMMTTTMMLLSPDFCGSVPSASIDERDLNMLLILTRTKEDLPRCGNVFTSSLLCKCEGGIHPFPHWGRGP
eukprot:11380478-Karenia_brevis.AAC.1